MNGTGCSVEELRVAGMSKTDAFVVTSLSLSNVLLVDRGRLSTDSNLGVGEPVELLADTLLSVLRYVEAWTYCADAALKPS